MVLDDEKDIFGVGIESCIGEGKGESAVGFFVVTDPGPDIVVI